MTTIVKKSEENLKKWEEMCNIIDSFIKKNTRIPSMRSNDRNEKVLGRWCFLQMTQFRKHKIHPYHIRRLKEIGVIK
jgi:hypothetical protein